MQADDQGPRLIEIPAIKDLHLDHVGQLKSEIVNGDSPHLPQTENSILRPRIDPNRTRPRLMAAGRLRTGHEELGISRPSSMEYALSVRAIARCLIPG